MRTTLLFPAFIVVFISGVLFAQEELKPWERLGLSLTEWKLITDSKMPMSKVESLLKDGIGISEYFRKPWEPIGLTESKWIAKRRSGLTNYDIEQQVLLTQKDTSMQPTPDRTNSFQEFNRSRETGELATALLLPGFQQCRYGCKGRGRTMISLAALSIAGTTAWSIYNRQFMPLPLLVVLLPDIGWSFIDHKIRLEKKHRQ